MGKKMGVRGRPGLLFIAILIIFLVIFFLTWKSMITPKRNSEVKDVYSMNYQSGKQSDSVHNQPHSFNDIWHRAKSLHGEEHESDEDYHFKNPDKLEHTNPNEKVRGVKTPLSNLLQASQQTFLKDVATKPYYKKPDESLKIIGGRMERFVHLDLKGAAPKVSYLKEIFPLFSRLGATGLLIEYEDMFPYSGRLQVISAENSYTKQQITEILSLAKLNSLKVIPLIQTFGHMEFILKALQMEGLRESKYTPQVINVASNASYDLIQEMVSQILEAHPAVSYLHVGCDEVYELGRGKSADIIIKEKLTNEALFLRHVKRVADIVAKTSDKKVRPIIWDDELRKMPETEIRASGIPSSVDIMVWRYTQNITDKLNETVWKKYGRIFKTVWAASSFKGATGPRQIYTEPQHHIINHFSWMDVVSKYGSYVSFKGIALTGWQRFDHFATLCELLPVAIPSLAVCLATIRNGGFNEDIHKTTSSLLGCSGMIEMGFPKLEEKERKAIVTQDCRFPGHMVYYAIQELWGYKQFAEEGRLAGWLSDYQVRRGFSNPGQLNVLSMRMFSLESNLLRVKTPLESNLLQIYSEDTVEEWLEENVLEMKRKIIDIQEKVKGMMKNTHWARRPNLPIVNNMSPVIKSPVIKPPELNANGGNGVRRDLGSSAAVATKRPEMNQNVGNNVRRNLDPNVEVVSGNKIQSLVHNDDKVNLLQHKLDNQNHNFGGRLNAHQAPHSNNVNLKSNLENNQLPQMKVDNLRSQQLDMSKKGIQFKYNVLPEKKVSVFNNLPQQHLGTNEHTGLFNKNNVAGLSKKTMQGISLDEPKLGAQRRQMQNSLNTNTGGQEDHLKRMSSDLQTLNDKTRQKINDQDHLKRLSLTTRTGVYKTKSDAGYQKMPTLQKTQHSEQEPKKGLGNITPASMDVKIENIRRETEHLKNSNQPKQMIENKSPENPEGNMFNDDGDDIDNGGDDDEIDPARIRNPRILSGRLDKLEDDNFEKIHKALVNERNEDEN